MSSLHCLDPTSTMKYVENCPDSKSSWDSAAERKGCHRVSDNCVGLQNLQYHCVTNPYMNETVEVCAPSRRMFGGYCPEYSVLAGGVQENFASNCKRFKSPCPIFFMSSDTYKYPECSKMIKRRTTQSTIETSTNTHSENETKAGFSLDIMFILLGTSVVVVVLILLFIGKMMLNRRKGKHISRKKNEDVESQTDEKQVDDVDSGSDNQYPNSSSHLLFHPSIHTDKHDNHVTDAKQLSAIIDSNDNYPAIVSNTLMKNQSSKLKMQKEELQMDVMSSVK